MQRFDADTPDGSLSPDGAKVIYWRGYLRGCYKVKHFTRLLVKGETLHWRPWVRDLKIRARTLLGFSGSPVGFGSGNIYYANCFFEAKICWKWGLSVQKALFKGRERCSEHFLGFWALKLPSSLSFEAFCKCRLLIWALKLVLTLNLSLKMPKIVILSLKCSSLLFAIWLETTGEAGEDWRR